MIRLKNNSRSPSRKKPINHRSGSYLNPHHKIKPKKIALFLLILAMFLTIFLLVFDQKIVPTLDDLAKQYTHREVTKIMEKAVNQQMQANAQSYDYQELLFVEKNNDGSIALLVPNTVKLNLLVSDIVLQVEEDLQLLENKKFSIPFGAATQSKIFASLGPNIRIAIHPISIVNTKIRDDFINQGINQTRHRIWLEMATTFSIAIPFNPEEVTVNTEVLLCEGIIVGPIPNTYFNFSR